MTKPPTVPREFFLSIPVAGQTTDKHEQCGRTSTRLAGRAVVARVELAAALDAKVSSTLSSVHASAGEVGLLAVLVLSAAVAGVAALLVGVAAALLLLLLLALVAALALLVLVERLPERAMVSLGGPRHQGVLVDDDGTRGRGSTANGADWRLTCLAKPIKLSMVLILRCCGEEEEGKVEVGRETRVAARTRSVWTGDVCSRSNTASNELLGTRIDTRRGVNAALAALVFLDLVPLTRSRQLVTGSFNAHTGTFTTSHSSPLSTRNVPHAVLVAHSPPAPPRLLSPPALAHHADAAPRAQDADGQDTDEEGEQVQEVQVLRPGRQ